MGPGPGLHPLHELKVRLGREANGGALTQGLTRIQVTRWQPPTIELLVNTDIETRIKLHQYFYPGWAARLDDGSTRLEVRPSSLDGLLEVQVPSGVHRVLIRRESLPQERVGQVVSGVSLAFLGVLIVRRRRQLGSMI